MKFALFLLPFLIATACACSNDFSDLELSPPRTPPAKVWKLRVETDDGLHITKEADGTVKIVQTKHFATIGRVALRIGDVTPMRKEMDFGFLNPLKSDISEKEFLETIEMYSTIREISHTAAKL